MKTEIDWKQIAYDNERSAHEFRNEIMLAAIAMLSLELDKTEQDSFSVRADKYKLTLSEEN